MFLKRLAEYAQELEPLPPLYQNKPVRYLLSLTKEGKFLGITDCGSEQSKYGLRMPIPKVGRTSGIRAFLLADHAAYVLGIPHKQGARQVADMHQQFVDLIQQCAEATQESTVYAVLTFLRSLDIHELYLSADYDPGACITFEVDGIRPIDLPSVQKYWEAVAAAGSQDHIMECLVCGQLRPAVRVLPILIQGIPDGQTRGMSLISADKDAFESYGLESSLTAPTCESCSEQFSNALNDLLREKKTHLLIPPLAYVFWTKTVQSTSILPTLSEAKAEDVRLLLEAFWRGKARDVDGTTTPFYGACLTARGPRIVIRDWIETTLEQAQQHLARYFWLQCLLDDQSNEKWFPLWQLVKATVNAAAKEKPSPTVGQALVHMALHGGPLPLSLLQCVLIRVRAERNVYPVHAALIKMILLSHPGYLPVEFQLRKGKAYTMAELEQENETPAYLCGRLLAMLEKIQKEAIPNLSSTITDRYYGTASSAPALVFARLLRGTQAHLTSIRNDKARGKLAAWLERDLHLILDPFRQWGNQFPATLTFTEQGIFALGYHHQKSALVQAAIAGAKLKAAKQQTGDASTALANLSIIVDGTVGIEPSDEGESEAETVD